MRTCVTGLVALIPLVPQIADAADIDEIPAVAAFVSVSLAISRVLALPSVNRWIETYIPWLAAEDPHQGKHRDHD